LQQTIESGTSQFISHYYILPKNPSSIISYQKGTREDEAELISWETLKPERCFAVELLHQVPFSQVSGESLCIEDRLTDYDRFGVFFTTLHGELMYDNGQYGRLEIHGGAPCLARMGSVKPRTKMTLTPKRLYFVSDDGFLVVLMCWRGCLGRRACQEARRLLPHSR
jgi:hypothetical protein